MKILVENFYQDIQKCLRGTPNTSKPKSTYIFYVDGQYLKKRGSLQFLSAYSPAQAVCILKTIFSEHRFKDVEAIDYVQMLNKRKLVPSPPTPKPVDNKPKQLDLFKNEKT